MTTPSKTKRVSSIKRSKKPTPSFKNTPPKDRAVLSPWAQAFLKRVQNTAAKYSLWNQKSGFILGISGGADSLCLLDIFFLLSKKYDFALHVAHVNYGLRGKDALRDEKLVREKTKLYGMSLSVLHPKKVTGGNLEERLRTIRYAFFEKLRKQKKFSSIVVAHHQDDQAETFLLRLLRGAGMSGLSAMRPKNGTVIRPLLECSRHDIRQYLKERGIQAREDKSNQDPKFLRNRIRHELLPLLEKKFQPNIKKILAQTATLLAEDYALIENITLPLASESTPPSLSFSSKHLLALPETLVRHTLRASLRPFFQGKNPPKGLIDELYKTLQSTKKKRQKMSFRGLKLERKGDTVTLLHF